MYRVECWRECEAGWGWREKKVRKGSITCLTKGYRTLLARSILNVERIVCVNYVLKKYKYSRISVNGNRLKHCCQHLTASKRFVFGEGQKMGTKLSQFSVNWTTEASSKGYFLGGKSQGMSFFIYFIFYSDICILCRNTQSGGKDSSKWANVSYAFSGKYAQSWQVHGINTRPIAWRNKVNRNFGWLAVQRSIIRSSRPRAQL